MTAIEWKPIAKGLATMVPGLHRLARHAGGGATDSADYCYGVWLKHLTFLWQSGMRQMPASVAELGPGESLGSGLAALLCGASRLYALDAVPYSNTEKSLRVLDELIERFHRRAPRPKKGWPDFDEHLDEDLFPSHILTHELLAGTLAPGRLSAIRQAILQPEPNNAILVKYVAPWIDADVVQRSGVDLIYSHSVLEHVNDLPATFECCADWLRDDGWMSHQVDFTSHGITTAWNGHWQYPEWMWKMIVGGRPYLINRHPASSHIQMLEAAGFKICLQLRGHRADGMPASGRSIHLRDEDSSCCGLFVQARKH